MTIEHSTITDPEMHEPKNIASAAAAEVYVANGAGSGDWESQAGAVGDRIDGLLSMQNNAIPTTIMAASTDGSSAVLVAGVWTVEAVEEMSGTADGRLTYLGVETARLPITFSVSLEPATGTNINLSAYVAIDGTVITGSRRSSTASSGQPTSVTLPWQETFTTSKFSEVFVENNDNTTNILVSSAIHRVN